MNLSNSQREGSSSCRCIMTLRGVNEGTEEIVLRILSKSQSMLEKSRKDVGHFWGLDAGGNGREPMLTNQTENGCMMLNFAESGQPIFRATSALERGENQEAKKKEKKSIHFDGSNETVELILRTVISVNHLTKYGAVPDLCKE